MDTFYYIFLFIIIMSLLLIAYAYMYNKIQNEILKLKEAEREIDETIRCKYDLMTCIIESVKNDSKDKELQNIEELKNSNLSSFEFIRKLSEYESKILNLKSEIKKLQKSQEFNNSLSELDEINIKLDAQKRYYNDSASLHNKMCVKFPSNIVAKITKIKERTYFDGKDLTDKIEQDFKI